MEDIERGHVRWVLMGVWVEDIERDHVRWVLMGGVGGRYRKGSCKMGTHGGDVWVEAIYKGIM